MTDVFKVLTPAKNINGEHTHVSMGDTKGTWYLSSDKSQEFYLKKDTKYPWYLP